jgi:hypothetical protein
MTARRYATSIARALEEFADSFGDSRAPRADLN